MSAAHRAAAWSTPLAPAAQSGRRLTVLLATEGTYPFHRGGVSTWCDVLTRRMPDVRYVVFAVVMNPFVAACYELPPNVERLISVPLWGTQDPAEHRGDLPFSEVLAKKHRTTTDVVARVFMPIFNDLVGHLEGTVPDPASFGRTLLALYRYLQLYDYELSFKSPQPWSTFRERTLAASAAGRWPEPSVFDLVQALGWVYRFLTVLNTPVPPVDLAHSSAAAFCGLPAIVAKLQFGTPYVLTEHGVYLREQYLAIGRSEMGAFGRAFLLNLVRTVVSANLHHADELAPVCLFNARWERRLGAEPGKIRPIYNGVSAAAFDPTAPARHAPSAETDRAIAAAGMAIARPSPARTQPSAPTRRRGLLVLNVARMDPNKDVETFLRAAALVVGQRSDISFRVQGAISVPGYHARMLELRGDLGLGQTVEFRDHSADIADAYREADVIVQSSVSEAFPYALIEAMMMGRPIVATEVGGSAEALGETGLLVASRQPALLAEAVLRLCADPNLRTRLGAAARARALDLFTIERTIARFHSLYWRMTKSAAGTATVEGQRLALTRALALHRLGMLDLALAQVDAALSAAEPSAASAALLVLRASCRLGTGQPRQAALDLVRARILESLRRTA